MGAAAEKTVDLDHGIHALRVVHFQRVFAVFCRAFGVVEHFFKRANDDVVVLVDHHAAHFQERVVEAVVVEHAAGVFEHAQSGVAARGFGGEVAPAEGEILGGNEGLPRFVKGQRIAGKAFHLRQQRGLRGGHRLHGGDVDFFAQAVLVQLQIGGQRVGFAHTVCVVKEIVQAAHFYGKAVFLCHLHHGDAGGRFLVGVGIEHQHRPRSLGLAAPKGIAHRRLAAPLRFVQGFGRPAVHAVFVGKQQIVFDAHDFAVGILREKLGGFLRGKSRFARALMAA